MNYNQIKNSKVKVPNWLKIKIKRTNHYLDPIIERIKEGDRVLDIGSGDQKLKDLVKKKIKYYSLDNDESTKPDFTDVDNIPEGWKFDKIVMAEFIEHISYRKLIRLLEGLERYQKEDTEILITTPNVYYTKIFEFTHIQFYKPKNIISLLDNFGYNSEIYRLWVRCKKWFIELVRIFRFPLTYLLEIDLNCKKIFIIARRKKNEKFK